MAPEMSLSYSSGAPAGMFGAGFSLVGAGSTIARCGQTHDLEGTSTAVQFDDTDRLCLDGQRLVAVDGVEYWEPDAEYRVANRSYDRIRVSSDGEHAYELTRRDGTRLLFGGGEEATVRPYRGDRDPAGAIVGEARVDYAWRVEEVVDVNGNAIRFKYHQSDAPDFAFEHRLKSIHYTESPGQPSNRSIEFDYESRGWEEHRFFSGVHERLENRVYAIRVMARGNLVRRYIFKYTTGSGRRDRLDTLRECDRFAVCRPETSFFWSETSVVDTLVESIPTPSHWDYPYSGWQQTLEVGDVNGDGFDDIIYSHVDPDDFLKPRLFVRLSKEGTSECIHQGMWNRDACPPPPSWTATGPWPHHEEQAPRSFEAPMDMGVEGFTNVGVPYENWFRVVDLDHDGKDEVLINQPDGGLMHWDLYSVWDASWVTQAGQLPRRFAGNVEQSDIFGCGSHPNVYPIAPIVGDFNGDGGSDLLGTCIPNSDATGTDHRFARFDWDAYDAGAYAPLAHSSAGSDPMYGNRLLVDVDGDGQSEVMSVPYSATFGGPAPPTPSDGLASVLAVGTDPSLLPAVHLPVTVSGTTDPQSYIFLDINGDGLQDALRTDPAGLFIRLNTGRGFAPEYQPTAATGYWENAPTSNMRVEDFNLDGREDLLVTFGSYSGPPRVVLHLSVGTTFELHEMADPGDSNFPPGTSAIHFSHIRLLDFNGNGDIEYTQLRDGELQFREIDAERADLLTSIEDGASRPSVTYVRTDSEGCGAQWPQVCDGARHVVGAFTQEVNVLGAEETRTVAYDYRDGRRDAFRGGFLGFGEREVRDRDATDARPVEVTETDFTVVDLPYRRGATPFAGRPSRTVRQADGRVEVREFTFEVQQDHQASLALRILPSDELSTTQLDGQTEYRSSTTRSYDEFGTLKFRDDQDLLGSETATLEVVLENRIADWLIGLAVEERSTSAGGFGSRTRETFTTFDALGRTEKIEFQPNGGKFEHLITTYAFDPNGFGNIETVTVEDEDGEKRISIYEYDSAGLHLERMTNAVGHEAEYSVDDASGAVLGQRLHDPGSSAYVDSSSIQDGYGRTVSQTENGVTTTFSWSASGSGQTHVVTSPSGHVTTTLLDRFGRVREAQRIIADGRTAKQRLRYDERGQLARESGWFFDGGAPGAVATRKYDRWGRPVVSTNLHGGKTTYEYLLRSIVETNPRGGETQTILDTTGRPKLRLEPDVDGTVSPVSFMYEAFGDLRSTTDALGNVVGLIRDDLGRIVQRFDPDSGTEWSSYNAFGEREFHEDALGKTRTFKYDLLGRLTERNDTLDGTTAYVYDTAPGFGTGALHMAIGPSATVSFEYDSYGRRRVESQMLGSDTLSLTRNFDAATGLPSKVILPGMNGQHELQHVYATDGSLSQLLFDGTSTWRAIERNDPLNRLTVESRGDMHVERTFDPAHHELLSYQAFRVGSPSKFVNRQGYQYDQDGRLDSFTDDGTPTAFDYDKRGRLTTWNRGATQVDYAYDSISNQTLGATGARTFGVSAGPHTIETQNGVTFTHDAAGRRTASSAGFSASYTSFNLPEVLVDGAGHSRSYLYGPFGGRVHEVHEDGTNVRRFGMGIRRTSGGGQPSIMTFALYADGERVVEVDEDSSSTLTARYLTSDQVGTSLGWLESDGPGHAGPVSEPFGAVLSGSADEHRFGSHAFDAPTGFVNAKGRLYDPATAIFLSTDPIRAASNTLMNLYAYSLHDPVNMNDPTGHYPGDGDGGGSFGGGGPVAAPSGGPPAAVTSDQFMNDMTFYDLESWHGMRADSPIFPAGGIFLPRDDVQRWDSPESRFINGGSFVARIRIDYLATFGVDLHVDISEEGYLIRAYQHLGPPAGGTPDDSRVLRAQYRALMFFGGDGIQRTITTFDNQNAPELAIGNFLVRRRDGNYIIFARDSLINYDWHLSDDMSVQLRLGIPSALGIAMQLYHEFVHIDLQTINERIVVDEVNRARAGFRLPERVGYTLQFQGQAYRVLGGRRLWFPSVPEDQSR